ncbi:aldehyde dehydrogenase family protein [Novosphingobium sp. Leaf2]|uniref:aldehyde dehydrogenase family protein n=1 Tax=Novosphingobium sp. Leaf2 TaxID=1735670 RepID=UPI0006F791AB|nr:aldehyde dehydrogenase family protein [Novosphingobium sp. Leaf2]KQM14853.1 aldehyde dehydrogenase [Novosphingobium sp. Leaf2]
MLLNGMPHAGAATFPVVNPATGATFALCPKADRDILDEAVAAARRAWPNWSATPQDDRASAIAAIADAMTARAAEFAALLTCEQGKPADQAMAEVRGGIGLLRAAAAMRIEDRTIRADDNMKVVERRRSLGVVAAIAPWNFPIILMLGKVGAALITGNTLLLKPAATTPLTILLFGEICQSLLPAGVINIICDENDLGEAITSHPDIAKIAFTGSTATGRKVMASASGTIKRITLELGGNDAAIVLDDVDPVDVARRIFPLAMANAGQVCMAIKRIFVPARHYDAFCNEMAAIARSVVVGNGADPGVQMGPVQNRAHFDKLRALLDRTRQEGTIMTGGHAIEGEGLFIEPTVVRDIADDAELVREEQFGPIIPILRYTDVDDAVVRANAGPFGLGGSVWGADCGRAAAIAERLQTGTSWVNTHLVMDPAVPFRGAKQSGLGTELGQEGLHEFTQGQVISIALSSAPARAA